MRTFSPTVLFSMFGINTSRVSSSATNLFRLARPIFTGSSLSSVGTRITAIHPRPRWRSCAIVYPHGSELHCAARQGRVHHRQEGRKTGRNIYYLLLSPRLLALLRKLGIPTHEVQISGTAAESEVGSQEAHENFSPYIRDQRDQDTPLSPFRNRRLPPLLP